MKIPHEFDIVSQSRNGHIKVRLWTISRIWDPSPFSDLSAPCTLTFEKGTLVKGRSLVIKVWSYVSHP